MKTAKSVSALLLSALMVAGCTGEKKQAADDLITIDVSATYPKKELILQDFMDVEYIPLETSDEFITQGLVEAIGKDVMIVRNWSNDGNIFVFDRKTGKALKKINRKGQGAEEYVYISKIVLDEEKNEIFVNSASIRKILVYDLSGNFKRSLPHTEGTEYLDILDYDKDNLMRYEFLGYKDGEKRGDQSYHAIISKQDGNITRNIFIPFEVIKGPTIREGEVIVVTTVSPFVPYHDNFLLTETSSDTIYQYVSKENKLIPFIAKTQTEGPDVLFTMGTVTDRYYFLRTTKKKFNFKTGRGFPFDYLLYDKQEKAVFNPSVLNADFVKRNTVDMTSNPVNGKEIASFQILSAPQLVEAYEKDELKGKLKEVVATLDEESNPVLMIMKYKK